jgi:hypothetical protein
MIAPEDLFFFYTKSEIKTSVADPYHLGVDPDPDIHASD